MRLAVVLLALLAVPPLALGSHDPEAYEGVATQGSMRSWRDWQEPGVACGDTLTPFRYTLVVLDGAATDALLLHAPNPVTGALPAAAIARPGAPASVESLSGSTCPDFTVVGLVVQHEAAYRVLVEHL
jgi:hypothetical protein